MLLILILVALLCMVHAIQISHLNTGIVRSSRDDELKVFRGGHSSVDREVEPPVDEFLLPVTAHELTVDETLKQFKTSLDKGLSGEEAQRRLSTYGLNELKAMPKKSLWTLFAEQFDDRLVQILLAVATLSAVLAASDVQSADDLHAFTEPLVILLILFINAAIGIAQAQSAEESLESLKKLQPETATVLREGAWNSDFPVSQIVPGDIISLRVGDKIPADARILALKTITFSTEEGSLTGESVPVGKSIEPVALNSIVTDKQNTIFSGTMVTNGGCYALVVGTGQKTEIGAINTGVHQAMQDHGNMKTPLALKLDHFGDEISKIIGIICLFVWIVSIPKFSSSAFSSRWKGAIYYAKIAVALGVAAIPEGLPAVITLCLSLGTTRMAKRNVVVRKLPSVETLGCTSVICTDKTGTLTTNQMTVKKLVVMGSKKDSTSSLSSSQEDEDTSLASEFDSAEDKILKNKSRMKDYTVEGVSYDPHGRIVGLHSDEEDTASGHINTHMQSKSMQDIASISSLCNDASLEYKEGAFGRIGEPTEAALKVLVEKMGVYNIIKSQEPHTMARQSSDYWKNMYEKLAVLEFNRDRKSMSVLVRSNTNQASTSKSANRLFIKGAAEMVAARCNRIQLENGRVVSITSSMREEINDKIREMQSEPLRCLALAFKDGKELPGNLASVSTTEAATALPELQDDSNFVDIESNMVLAAITGIKDPARPEAGDAIVKCTNAGIRVMMMTGDSKDTAVAIARDVNIFGPYENTHIATSAFTGKEFFELPTDIQLNILSAGNKVFCRTEPKDKQKLISMLDGLGEVCAMTGDGVNDAPALQQADIGIAMGITGTEVSKNAADMILTDDNFATIVTAVEEGRNIYNNMQSFICFLLSCNIGEIVTIFISTALGIPEALTPLHLLWVNLVTDGPPATALGFNPSDPAAMTKPPRPKDEEIMSKSLLLRYVVTGLYVGFATISSFIWWYRDKHVSLHHLMNWGSCADWHSFTHSAEIPRLPDEPCNIFVGKHKSSAQSVALTTLVTMEMLKALSAVSLNQSLFSVAPWQNKYLLVGVTVPFLLHFAVLYVPWLSEIFGLTPLNEQEWQVVLKFALPILILEEILKWLGRRQFEDKEEQREEGQRAHIVSE